MPSIHSIVADVRMKAAIDPSYQLRCVVCGEKVFFVEHLNALVPGHIYSDLGVQEFNITQFCEYCFDAVTMEVDEIEEED